MSRVSYYVEMYWQFLAEITGSADELKEFLLTARGIGIDLMTDYGVYRFKNNAYLQSAVIELYQWGLLKRIDRIKAFMRNKLFFLEGQEPDKNALQWINGELAKLFPKNIRNIPEELKAIGIDLSNKNTQLVISKYPQILADLGIIAGLGFFEKINKAKKGMRMTFEELKREIETYPKTEDGQVDKSKLTLYQSLKYAEYLDMVKAMKKKEEEKQRLFKVFEKTIEQAKKKKEQIIKTEQNLEKLYERIAKEEDKKKELEMEFEVAKKEINEVAALLVQKGVDINSLKEEVKKLNENENIENRGEESNADE